jgi:hypothetical protein
LEGEAKRKERTKVNDELHNLANRDVLLPPDPNAARTLEVVPVHNNVDSQVGGDDRPRNGCMSNELGVAEERCRTVVVGMEEG